jgi:hypothetical protein
MGGPRGGCATPCARRRALSLGTVRGVDMFRDYAGAVIARGVSLSSLNAIEDRNRWRRACDIGFSVRNIMPQSG